MATAGVQRRHRPDYRIILYIGLIMMIGLIIIYAIGPQRAEVLNSAYKTDFYTSSYFFLRQLMSLAVAIVAILAIMFTPIELIKKHAGKIMLAGVVASLILAFFGNFLTGVYGVENGLAECKLGACRWISLGPLSSFQPAELLKFGVLVFVAKYVAARIKQGKLNDWKDSLWWILAIIAVSEFLVVVLQKDLGTGVALLAIVASMLVLGGISPRNGAKILVGLTVVGALAVAIAPHRIARVQTFLRGDDAVISSTDGASYHTQQARIALGVGSLFGVGIGNSVQATGYLPEAINDSVFAIIGETFGFIGATVIIVLFSGLLIRILSLSDRLADPWSRMVVAGVFGWMGAHVIINIASMIGVFPLTGITLPLLSFGGTSMVFVALAIGLVLNISRYTSHEVIREESADAGLRSRRGVGRTRYASPSRY